MGVTYITPDDIALKQESEHYWTRPSQGPAFVGGKGFRGEVMPLLGPAPLPPFTSKQRTLPSVVKLNRWGTYSPYDENVKDPRGPGMFQGTLLGTDEDIQAMETARGAAASDIASPVKAITGTVVLVGVALFFLMRR